MSEPKIQRLMPFLWFAEEAEEAARFYTGLFPDSRIDSVTSMMAESPSGPPGSVVVVAFTLFGQSVTAMSAGPHDPFNDAISLMVSCEDQDEIDRYWDGILANGGKPQACGWINDRYGLRWQIVPTRLGEMMSDPDREKAARVAAEMMRQIRFDIGRLEAAFDGRLVA